MCTAEKLFTRILTESLRLMADGCRLVVILISMITYANRQCL